MRLLFVLLLAGCTSAPAVTKEDRDALGREWLGCLQDAARRLDDGVSDARTVAYPVRAACDEPGRRYAEAFVVGEPEDFRLRFLRQMEAKQLDSATAAVLRERRR